MNIKEVLMTGLKKTYLNLSGVDDYYIFWKVSKGDMKLSSIVSAHGTKTLCSTKIKSVSIDQSEFVLNNPDKLLKILNISGEDLKIKLPTKTNLKLSISDKVYDSEFTLCDPLAIGISLPELEEPDSYDVVLELTDDFINRFIQAKKANGSELVSVEVVNRTIRFQLGDNTDYSNKISFAVEEQGIFDMEKVLFSSDILEEIFTRNKGNKGRLFVSPEGLMKLIFDGPDTESIYYIVALDKL
jgi:hypothetical protein